MANKRRDYQNSQDIFSPSKFKENISKSNSRENEKKMAKKRGPVS